MYTKAVSDRRTEWHRSRHVQARTSTHPGGQPPDTIQPHTTDTLGTLNRHQVIADVWYSVRRRNPSIHRTIMGQSRALGAHVGEMQPRRQQHNHRAVLRSASYSAAAVKPVTPTLSVTLPVSFQTVSRPLELSLQSSLQLSFTVLVRYRSHGHI